MDNYPNRVKDERFKKIAHKRVIILSEALRRLSNCADRRSYIYSEIDISTICSQLDEVVLNIKILQKEFQRKAFTEDKILSILSQSEIASGMFEDDIS